MKEEKKQTAKQSASVVSKVSDKVAETSENEHADNKGRGTGTGVGEQNANVSLREILVGDVFARGGLRRQMGLIVLCVVFAIIYITNRYSAELELIEIENLKKELDEVRNYGLIRSGELTEKTRQSRIERMLKSTPDSLLSQPDKPPFLIQLK